MMSLFSKIKILYRMLSLSRAPEDYRRVEAFRLELQKVGAVKRSLAQLEAKTKQSATAVEYFSEDAEQIRALGVGKRIYPEGSLGGVLQGHLRRNGIELEYFDSSYIEGTKEEKIYTERILLTHDCWHVLLGIQTDRISEIQLQSLLYQQTFWPTAAPMIAGFLIKTFFESPARLPDVFSRVVKAFEIGSSIPNLYFTHWTPLLKRDLQEIRKNMGLEGFMIEEGFHKIELT
ncbi:MAG: Coq4 family protein [Pseudomonadota bacterium]